MYFECCSYFSVEIAVLKVLILCVGPSESRRSITRISGVWYASDQTGAMVIPVQSIEALPPRASSGIASPSRAASFVRLWRRASPCDPRYIWARDRMFQFGL